VVDGAEAAVRLVEQRAQPLVVRRVQRSMRETTSATASRRE